jgi:hypothetical protein
MTIVKEWLSADRLFARIEAMYPAPRYATFGEVRNAGGFNASRSADAVVVALWPSDGHRIMIIEIKQSRSDWLRELKNPAKGNEMQALGDALFVVANRDDVKVEEVPETWGLMVPARSSLVILKPATFTPQRSIDRGFLSSMLKRSLTQKLTEIEAKAIADRVRAETEESVIKRLGNWEKRWNELIEKVGQYEQASGVHIQYGNVVAVGEAVRAVLSGEEDVRRCLSRLDVVSRILTDLHREVSAQIEKAKTELAAK